MKKRGIRKRTVASAKKNLPEAKDRYKLVCKNLLFFFLASILFVGFYFYSEEIFYSNLFLLLSMIFGAVTLAFFVAFVVLLFLKGMRKK